MLGIYYYYQINISINVIKNCGIIEENRSSSSTLFIYLTEKYLYKTDIKFINPDQIRL